MHVCLCKSFVQVLLLMWPHQFHTLHFQVLKIAILAEKFAVDYTWYVDTILSLIRLAGDYVSEEVWYRVVQIVINREDVQGYAAKTCFEVCGIVCGGTSYKGFLRLHFLLFPLFST